MKTQDHFIVTGGCGFIGANLVAELLHRVPRAFITIVDDFSSGNFSNVIAACDRRSVAPFAGECRGVCYTAIDWRELVTTRTRAIFHLAAITDTTMTDQARMLEVNTHGFREMVALSIESHVSLAYASSAATYGTPAETAARKPFPLAAAGRPSNVYGFSKWLVEAEHLRAAQEAGRPAKIVGLRYFNVFGPGEAFKGKMASMVRQLARKALENEVPRLFEDGSQARDQVYVDDVVDATLAAGGVGAAGEVVNPRPGVYNVGSGVATSFNQILEALRRVEAMAGIEAEYFEMPPAIRAFYQDYTCADLTETRQGLNWAPKWKPAEAITHYGSMLAGDSRL